MHVLAYSRCCETAGGPLIGTAVSTGVSDPIAGDAYLKAQVEGPVRKDIVDVREEPTASGHQPGHRWWVVIRRGRRVARDESMLASQFQTSFPFHNGRRVRAGEPHGHAPVPSHFPVRRALPPYLSHCYRTSPDTADDR